MRHEGVRKQREFLLCAWVAAGVLACGMQDEPAKEVEVTSDATLCSVREAGDPWWVATFPQQTGRFHVRVQATPSANNIDAVIGISKGAASKWTQLAAIVRFAPNGILDVRRGGAYAADVHYPYQASRTYYFRIDIDVAARAYTVWVKESPSASYSLLARDYPFRTEQANVTSLDAAAVYLEPSRPGSLEVCDLNAIKDDSTADGCVTSTAGGTFANAWMEPVQGAMVARFQATPSASFMDGVVGYTTGSADAYNDFVASVRFWTNGRIEARDGDTYRATNAKGYVAGRTYEFYVVLDFATGRYSVYVSEGGDPESFTLIAENFRFRPQQANASLISNVATVVASSTGQVRACDYATTSAPELRHVRTGQYALAPFRDGRIVISDGATTQVVDGGRTLASAALAAQHVTVDASGNVYLATLDPATTTLTLRSVTSTLQPRWTRSYAVRGGVRAMGAYDNGNIAIALGAPGYQVAELLAVRPDGSEHSRIDLLPYAPQAIGIGRDRFAIGYGRNNQVVVEARALDGSLIWQKQWSGSAWVYDIAVEPSGSVVFGGTFGGDGIDFGTGWFEAGYSSEVILNGYIVALSSTGGLRFAHRLYADGPTSLASNGDRIAYATTQWTQTPDMQLWVYDAAGTELHGDTLHLAGEDGVLGPAIVDSEGRVIVNASMRLHPSAQAPIWPVLASFVF